MYKSPIDIIYDQMRTQINTEFENTVVKAVQDYGINVDKEELLKALKYDREQYEKGYKDAKAEIIRCKDCVKHNKRRGYYLDGTVIGIKDCCPLVEIRGMAQGHEFDYQYCAYAERRTNEADYRKE